jgi:hypothetical protein
MFRRPALRCRRGCVACPRAERRAVRTSWPMGCIDRAVRPRASGRTDRPRAGAERGIVVREVSLRPHVRDAGADRRRVPRPNVEGRSSGEGSDGTDPVLPPRPPGRRMSHRRRRPGRRPTHPGGRFTAVAILFRLRLSWPLSSWAGKPPSSSGLGHRPFKAAARVRIPLGARSTTEYTRVWRSPESSSPCQGEDRGIEARHPRQLHRARSGR